MQHTPSTLFSDRKIVLESVVEVNDFSELWPDEADQSSQIPLILLLTGMNRQAVMGIVN
jgi:hypothetical protein